MYVTLEHGAAKGGSESWELFIRIKCVTFLLLTGFLCDVLSVIT